MIASLIDAVQGMNVVRGPGIIPTEFIIVSLALNHINNKSKLQQINFIFEGETSAGLAGQMCDEENVCQEVFTKADCPEERFYCTADVRCMDGFCQCYINTKCLEKTKKEIAFTSLKQTGSACLDMKKDEQLTCSSFCRNELQGNNPQVCNGKKTEYVQDGLLVCPGMQMLG